MLLFAKNALRKFQKKKKKIVRFETDIRIKKQVYFFNKSVKSKSFTIK